MNPYLLFTWAMTPYAMLWLAIGRLIMGDPKETDV